MARRQSDADFQAPKCEHPRLSEVYAASGKICGYQCLSCKAPVRGVEEPKPHVKTKIVSRVIPGLESFMGTKDKRKAGLK